MKKLVCLICLACFVPATTFGQPPGVVTPIDKGEKAPFAGVLFDNDAVAHVLASMEALKEACALELTRQQAIHDEKQRVLRELLEADLEAERQKRI